MDTEIVRQMEAEEVVKIVNRLRKNYAGENVESIIIEHIAAFAVRTGGEVGFALLKELYKDLPGRLIIARYAVVIGGSAGIDLLWGLVEDEDVRVRIEVVRSAEELGGLVLLGKLAEDDDFFVRIEVAISAVNIGGIAGTALLREFIRGGNASEEMIWLSRLAKSEFVDQRMLAVSIAALVGEEDGIALLLERLTQDPDVEVSRMARAKLTDLSVSRSCRKLLSS